MRRLLGSKKAISPVLSNLLLTVIAVSVMSLATTATYVISNNLREIMGERFVAEDVWFNSGKICVYLRNTGKVSLEISRVYVNSTPYSFTPLKLEVNGHGWLNISCNWISGYLYHINIVSNRGNKVADYFRAP